MALVQKNGGTTNGSASIVTSLGSATTAGNTILIFVNGAGTITTPSGFTSRSPQVNTQGLIATASMARQSARFMRCCRLCSQIPTSSTRQRSVAARPA